MKPIKLGISGIGGFSHCFIELFQKHPRVRAVAFADLVAERRDEAAAKYGVTERYDSHEALCRSDVDAVAIFTQRHLHAPMAVAALKAGKHVYCAVPAASTVEQAEELVRTVEETGLIYMMGETSYYYPSALFCRAKFRAGAFGHFVYGEGEYMHDMSHGFYQAYQFSGGEQWRRVAGIPPMLYPTHSTSLLISVTGQRLTHVSCLGYRDREDDGVFGEGKNNWDNPFSNQTALFRTSDGGMFRANEFRRVGNLAGNCVRGSLYGTKGSYEEQGDSQLWTQLDGSQENLDELLKCGEPDGAVLAKRFGGQQYDFFTGFCKFHPVARLPKEYYGLPNGHYGSHQFLADDFVRSVTEQKLAPNHVWAAARYTVPGLIAHESSLREGERLPIPDFGDPPQSWAHLEGIEGTVCPEKEERKNTPLPAGP